MRQIFKIEREPFQDEHGFVLLPVMQIEAKGVRGNCTFCNGGCRPDKHHAYWPKPTTSDEKLETRIAIYGEELPDLAIDPYKQLRSAEFSISKPVCRRWHDALHNLQLPPKHLPDADIVRLALDQYSHIAMLGRTAAQLSELKKPGTGTEMKESERLIELVRLGIVNFPQEVVVPSIGYYCLVEEEGDNSPQLSQPVTFDYHKYLIDAQAALGRATKMLEDLN